MSRAPDTFAQSPEPSDGSTQNSARTVNLPRSKSTRPEDWALEEECIP